MGLSNHGVDSSTGVPGYPVRTCVGCRQREAKSALMRVVAQNHQLVVDAKQSLPGRGAWVHSREECVQQALRRRAFGRALRATDVDQSTVVGVPQLLPAERTG